MLIPPYPWKQGEHLFVTGETGSGKTTLMGHAILYHDFCLSLRTKYDKSPIPGKVVKTSEAFKKLDIEDSPFVVLNPKTESQYNTFLNALDIIWKEKGWAIYFDELYYLSDQLHLDRELVKFFTQGRSMGITCIAGMQRPSGNRTTRWCMSQSTHVVSFYQEGRDIKTLKEIGGNDWANAVASLKKYEFAWYYRVTREFWIGKLQDLIVKDEE